MINQLLEQWNTPYGTPPFPLFEVSHFKPAIEEAIKIASGEIDSITDNLMPPTFENTIAGLDRCGEKLGEITAVLFNLNSAETSKELQAAAQEVSPLLARFSNDVTLNERLFERVREVYDSRNSLNLNTEEQMLLEKRYRSFILGGAGLNEKERIRFREISEELSTLTLKFEENVLDDTNAFELHLTEESDLAGLPENTIEAASEEALKRNKPGWVFTLDFPSYMPFMQYSDRRDLREKMFRAYNTRAFHDDTKDNQHLLKSIVNLRLETAVLLGFRNYSQMVLGDRMADTPEKVDSFLEDLFIAAIPAARRDFKNIEEFAAGLGHQGKIERWDWAYYSEKLKKSRYSIDDEILRPYFPLEKVKEAIFGLTSRLYGLKYVPNDTIPIYNTEVQVYEVYGKDESLIAVLYLDMHPRKGKNGGAWMTSFRDQKKVNGKRIIPFISIVANFGRPTASKPALLTFSELTTFLHEFGHSLHGMLSDCTYESVSGTNVARDFVELPSQFMENWAFEKEWLDSWAVHYETGGKIPGEMIQKIKDASAFNEGYACNRQLGFCFLDMAWHLLETPFDGDITIFEGSAMEKTLLFPADPSLNMSCAFTHLFGGGYASGYYGYKWAEVLDADAFRFFKEEGIFNDKPADLFRKNILEKGGSAKPMDLYINFRGKEPSMEAFLERSGLKTEG